MVLFPWFLPFPKNNKIDSSKLKVFAEDNFKFNESGRKFAKQIKKRYAGMSSFSLSPLFFEKTADR